MTPGPQTGPQRRALLVEHDPYTSPGLVGEALEARGYALERRLVVPEERFHSPGVDHDFPDPREWDLVVPMGAPWSADDHATIGSWLVPELEMLRTAHTAGVPVLGICFGGQALSVALGGGVTRAPGWEIGWTDVVTADPALVPAGPWFQFHKDAMVLPPGALEVAANAHCSQAWTMGRTLALQFHPEVTLEVFDGWLETGGAAIMEGLGLDVEAVRKDTADGEDAARARTRALVEAFLDRVAARPL
ncbi:type 1 glutamine amidotransferase [Kineosporia sp. R_H_3]|uniref:type 1 glutamine amidotransferase n=1 Tax=Kineosporia sp. R_H_3 TaxID=1961848 RepID=UPI000B4A6D17|nr:type 1 glutamine amidotransferase [Kineosporia sp. R_H_3]